VDSDILQRSFLRDNLVNKKSESVNSMVKGGYLDNSKSVHEFTKCFLDVLVHINDNEAREKYYSQVCFLVCSYSAFKSNE
jgi:hypothetical protein